MRIWRSPLLVWILFFAIAGAGVLSLICYARTVSTSPAPAQIALKRLSSSRSDSKKLKIVILGDSLTNFAFLNSEQQLTVSLNEELADLGCYRDVEIFNASFGGFKLIQMDDWFRKAVALKPTILILQVELIAPWQEASTAETVEGDLEYLSHVFQTQATANLRKISLGLRKPFYGYLPGILLPKTKRPWMEDSKPAGENKQSMEPSEELEQIIQTRQRIQESQIFDRRIDRIERGPTKDPIVLNQARELVQKALAEGITVFILQTPSSLKMTSQMSQRPFIERRATLNYQLPMPPGFYLEYPRVLPDRYFSDSRHLNDDGRKVFLPWFARALAQRYVQENSCHL